MAKPIARLSGVMLRPGVSRNGRYYSPDMIARAVERAQARIDDDGDPLSMLTHHDAEDDSEKIVGALRKVWVGDDGAAMYEAELADTKPARTIATLADTSGGSAPFLRGVSIRGYWLGEPRTVEMQGQTVVTSDDMELDGLDFTKTPGIPGARVDSLELVGVGAPAESGPRGRFRITESVQEARMTVTEDADVATVTPTEAAPGCDGKCCKACGVNETAKDAKETAPLGPVQRWADHGYRPGGQKAFPLDTREQARESWRALRGRRAAEDYTPAQLLRMRERATKALAKHGVTVMPNGWLMEAKPATEAQVREYMGDYYAEPCTRSACFSVTVDNGTVCVTIYSFTIDPADLTVIARAAMDGACNALEAMDPDNDGDVDVPGMNETAPETAPSATETGDDASGGVTESDTDTAEQAASEPSPDSASAEKDTIQEEGEPGMAEPTTTAAAGAPAVTLSAEQFEALLARVAAPAAAPVESAPAAAAPVTETAPAAVEESAEARDARIARLAVEAFIKANPAAAPAPATPVVEETQEQRDAKIAEAAVRAYVQTAAEQGAVGARKGIVVDRGSVDGPRESADGVIVPEGVRDVPAHEWTAQEWRIVRSQMGLEAAGLAGEPKA